VYNLLRGNEDKKGGGRRIQKQLEFHPKFREAKWWGVADSSKKTCSITGFLLNKHKKKREKGRKGKEGEVRGPFSNIKKTYLRTKGGEGKGDL